MEVVYEYISAIYEAGSFRAAADKLHVTQPALSIALHKYEEQIGVMIFNRREHPFTLTPAGEIILRNIEQIKSSERKMKAELNDLKEMNTGEIHIGATHYVNSVILPPYLNQYMRQFPKIKVHLTEESSHEVLKGFLSGINDIAICASEYTSPEIIKIPLVKDRLIWVIPNRFLRYRKLESFADLSPNPNSIHSLKSLDLLKQIPFIALLPGDNIYKQAEDLFVENNILPQVCINVTQSTTAWHMSCSGIGATLVPESLTHIIPPSITDISMFHYCSPLMERTISVFYKKDQYLTASIQTFLEICRKWKTECLHNPKDAKQRT